MPNVNLEPQPFRDHSTGMLREVGNALAPRSSVRLAVNGNFDKIGAFQGRKGITLLGSMVDGSSANVTKNPDADPEDDTTDGYVAQIGAGNLEIDYLMVGGGGGGGATAGGDPGKGAGGGGAGGLIYKQAQAVAAGVLPVVVGAGGNAGAAGNNNGSKGSNTTFNSDTAEGGGYGGGGTGQAGGNGGSGGGGGEKSNGAKGSATGSQGNHGADGNETFGDAGGGGGAGSAAGTGRPNAGGEGSVNSITGTPTTYAEGGHGGTAGSGQNLTHATKGSGGGGANRDSGNTAGANGQAGVVVIRYKTADFGVCTGGTKTTDGDYTVHTFTTSGDFTVVAGDASFAGMKAAAGTIASDDDATAKAVRLLASTTTDKYDEMRRGIFIFDTSAIPHNAVITSGTLKLYVTAKNDDFGSQSISLTPASTISNTALEAADYAMADDTKLATDLTIAGITTSAQNTFTLNAAGMAHINVDGITKLAVRLTAEVNGSAPTWGSEDEVSVTVEMADNASTEPELYLEYDVGTAILGLHRFEDSAGTYSKTVVNAGSTLYYLDGSNVWQAVTSGTRTAAKKDRFLNALGKMYVTNATDGMDTWDGNPANALTAVSGAPAGIFLEWFKQKMYVWGTTTNPDRLFWSSIPNTSYAITWDTTNDWRDIHPKDGENATGMKRSGRELLLFKKNHLYRFFGVEGSDPDPIANAGTLSHESIIATDSGLYFHNPVSKAFSHYGNGVATTISNSIADIVEAIDRANMGDICGWQDGNHLYFSVGDVTIDDVSYINVVCRVSLNDGVWTIYSYPYQLLRAIQEDTGTVLRTLVGDDNSSVYLFNQGNTDNGQPISSELITQWQYFGFAAFKKSISQISAECDRGDRLMLSWQSELDSPHTWHKITDLAKIVNTTSKNFHMEGYRVRFRVHGQSSGDPFMYHGFEVIKGVIKALPVRNS